MTDLDFIDVADLRREYMKGVLRRHELTEQPLVLFEK